MAKVILSSVLVLLLCCSSSKRKTAIYVNVSNPYCIGCLEHLVEYLESDSKLAGKTKYLVNESNYADFVVLESRLKMKFKVHSRILSPESREIKGDSIHFRRTKNSPEVIIQLGDKFIVFENSKCFNADMLVSDTLSRTLNRLFFK